MRLAIATIIVFFLSGNTLAFDRAASHKHEGTPEMKKQHKTMSDIGRRWADAKGCLNDSKLDKMRKAVEDMLRAADNVPGFRLHKNADKHDEYQKECNLFKNDLERLKDALVARDIEMSKKFSESVDEACKRCHNRFK